MAFSQELVPNFNKKWAKGVSKQKFVEQHAHLGTQESLEAAYDKIVPPEETTEVNAAPVKAAKEKPKV